MTQWLSWMYKFMIKGDYVDKINQIIKEFGYNEIVQDIAVDKYHLKEPKRDITDDIGYVFLYNWRTIVTSLINNNFPVQFEEWEILRWLSNTYFTDIIYYAYFWESWFIKRLYSWWELIYKHEYSFLDDIDEHIWDIPDSMKDIFALNMDDIIKSSEKIVYKEFK